MFAVRVSGTHLSIIFFFSLIFFFVPRTSSSRFIKVFFFLSWTFACKMSWLLWLLLLYISLRVYIVEEKEEDIVHVVFPVAISNVRCWFFSFFVLSQLHHCFCVPSHFIGLSYSYRFVFCWLFSLFSFLLMRICISHLLLLAFQLEVHELLSQRASY